MIQNANINNKHHLRIKILATRVSHVYLLYFKSLCLVFGLFKNKCLVIQTQRQMYSILNISMAEDRRICISIGIAHFEILNYIKRKTCSSSSKCGISFFFYENCTSTTVFLMFLISINTNSFF